MAEVGYRSSDIGAPVGSISRQPNPAHKMLLLAYEDGIGIRATFLGDVSEDIADWYLVIDDTPYPVGTISYDAGRTSVVFEADEAPFVDGETYDCEFKAIEAPTIVSNPVISGTPIDGQTIAEAFTLTPAVWSGADTEGGAWLVDDEEQADSYELSEGEAVKYHATASNVAGSASQDSNEIEVAAAPNIPANTSAPTITGSPAAGSTIAETMTLDNGTWTNSPTGYAQTLRLDDVIVTSTYTWQETDNGKDLVLTVVASNADGDSDPADSDPFAVVIAQTDPQTAEENLEAALSSDSTLWASDFRNLRGRVLTDYGEYDLSTILSAQNITFADRGAAVKLKDVDGNFGTVASDQPTIAPGLGWQFWGSVKSEMPNTENPTSVTNLAINKTGTNVGQHVLAVLAEFGDLGEAVVTPSASGGVAGLSPNPSTATQYSTQTFSITTAGNIDISITEPVNSVYLLTNGQASFGSYPYGSLGRFVIAEASSAIRLAENATLDITSIDPAFDPVTNGMRVCGKIRRFAPNYTNTVLDFGPAATGSQHKMRLVYMLDGSTWRFRVYINESIVLDTGTRDGIGDVISTGQYPYVWFALSAGPSGVTLSVRVKRSDSEIYEHFSYDSGMSDATSLAGRALSASDFRYMKIGSSFQSGTSDWTSAQAGLYGYMEYLYLLNGEAADGAELDRRSYTELANQSIAPMELGINEMYIDQDSTWDVFNDRGLRAKVFMSDDNGANWADVLAPGGWSTRFTEDGLNDSIQVAYDGTIGPGNSWGATHLRFQPPIYWCASGTAQVYLPAGLGASFASTGVSGAANASYDNGTGILAFDIIQGSNSTNQPTITVPWAAYVGVSGRKPPQMGLIRTGNTEVDDLGGDTNIDIPLTPEALANYQALCTPGAGLRLMEAQRINTIADDFGTMGQTDNTNPVMTQPWTGRSTRGWMGIDAAKAAAIANQSGRSIWFCTPIYATNDYVEAEASKLALVSSDLNVRSELGNEIWNAGFINTWNSQIEGARRGYCPSWVTTHADAADYQLDIYDYLRKIDRDNNALLEACPVGRIIMVPIAPSTLDPGRYVLECIQEAPVGTFAHDPEYFTPLWNTEDLNRAMWRYKARKSKEVWAVQDAVFATAGRQRPIHVMAAAANELQSMYKTILDFDNAWQVIDEFSIGGYGAAIGPFGNSDKYPTGWKTEADQTLMYHDLEAAAENYLTLIAPTIKNAFANDAGTGKFEALKAFLANYLASKNADPDRIIPNMYEGLQDHWVQQGYPCMAPNWASNVNYSQYEFVFVSGEGTYRSLVSGNLGNTPSTSPSQWALYVDGQGYTWDATNSAAFRNSGGMAYQRLWLNTIRSHPSAEALWLDILEEWETKIGGAPFYFARMNRDATTGSTSRGGSFQGWGLMLREDDTAGGVYQAMASKTAELMTV